MDEVFILRVVLSFLLGGAYIALITRISELFGAKIGGVLSSTPTTALMGMIFLAIAETTDSLVEAAPGIIIGISSSMVMLMAYIYIHRRFETIATLILSVCFWMATALSIKQLDIENVFVAVCLFALLFLAASKYFTSIKEIKADKKPASLASLAQRMVFAGTVVSSVLIASRIAGPFWGGLAAGFPAMYISNLLILEREQGHKFTASVIKHLPIGSFSTVSFGVAVGYFAKNYGSAVSILLAFVVSLVVAYSVYVYKNRQD